MSDTAQLKLFKWGEVEKEFLNPLIDRQMLVGDKVMLARVLLKKGAHVPLHHHHNEQVTYILEGALKFAIDGKELVLHAGEVLCIPPQSSSRRARTGSPAPTLIFATAAEKFATTMAALCSLLTRVVPGRT